MANVNLRVTGIGVLVVLTALRGSRLLDRYVQYWVSYDFIKIMNSRSVK